MRCRAQGEPQVEKPIIGVTALGQPVGLQGGRAGCLQMPGGGGDTSLATLAIQHTVCWGTLSWLSVPGPGAAGRWAGSWVAIQAGLVLQQQSGQ